MIYKKRNKKILAVFLVLISIVSSVLIGDVYTEAATKNIKVSLSNTEYVYSGKECTPKVTVKYNNKKLGKKYYSVKYSSGRKNVGKYCVTVSLKDKYKGTKKVYYKIVPQAPKLENVTSIDEGFTAKWNKISKQVTGYEVQYNLSNNSKSATTVKVKSNCVTVTDLLGDKTYLLRVRAYKNVKGTTYYSKWSAYSKAVPAKVYHFRSEYLRNQHYEKHGIEMGFSSAIEYEKAASDVVKNSNSLHKLEKEDGDDVYYLEATNDFVIVSTDGYIRTYFRPEDGRSYFDRQ